MKFQKSIWTISIALLWSCLGEYNLELPDREPALVVDALVTTTGTQIELDWSFGLKKCYDTTGYSLQPTPCQHVNTLITTNIEGFVSVKEKETGNTVLIAVGLDANGAFEKISSAFKGTPGNHYELTITLNFNGIQHVYTANAFMRPTPVINEITYEIRKGDIGKSDDFVPLIFFHEPKEEKNFYLFQICETFGNGSYSYCGSSRVWTYSIIDDIFLPESVKGLSIDNGATVAKYAQFYPSPGAGVGVIVKMYSIDKLTYFYYKNLLDQFTNDGGAYSPMPSSPKGNISGDALGIFRALQESSATVYY